MSDLEIVWLIHDVFQSLGLEDFEVKMNNRKILTAISEYIGEPGKEGALCVAIDKLDKVGQDEVMGERTHICRRAGTPNQVRRKPEAVHIHSQV